ncbi:MAG TPA: outer membrane beta-barrel protein [Gammaproteobacteria bacterium]
MIQETIREYRVMNLKHCILATALWTCPLSVFADAPQNYWGMSYEGIDLEETAGTELDMNGFSVRYGLWFPFDLIAVEARIGFASEESGDIVGDPIIKNYMGLAKANLPFEKVNLYAMGGVSKTYYNFDGVETDDDDVVGGMGIELLASETSGLTIEFLRYGVDEADLEGTILSIGFNHRFELPGFR